MSILYFIFVLTLFQNLSVYISSHQSTNLIIRVLIIYESVKRCGDALFEWLPQWLINTLFYYICATTIHNDAVHSTFFVTLSFLVTLVILCKCCTTHSTFRSWTYSPRPVKLLLRNTDNIASLPAGGSNECKPQTEESNFLFSVTYFPVVQISGV